MMSHSRVSSWKRWTVGLGLGCALSFGGAVAEKKIQLPQDKGPETLDVSSASPELQQGYKLTVDRCAKCHTAARALNTTMSLEDWKRYVKRMMHKPNSDINEEEAKQIYAFLEYDQTSRRDKDPKSFFPALSDEEIKKLQDASADE